jgi:hypothetical protein
MIGPFPDRGERCPGHGADAIAPLSLSGEQTNIPEFNDCQRFIVTNSQGVRVYGQLYAVFAAMRIKEKLEELKQLECRPSVQVIQVPGANPGDPTAGTGPTAGQPPTTAGGQPLAINGLAGGNLVAAPRLRTGNRVTLGPIALRDMANEDIAVTGPNLLTERDCRARENTEYNGVAIPFAEIVSWGGWYGPLGIKPNYNCLYLYDSAALKAIMVPLDMDEAKCGAPIDPNAVNGTKLQVRVTKRKGLSSSDIPPVARWDRGQGRAGITYVGMACGPDLWCEIGPRPGSLAGAAQAYSAQYKSAANSTKERRVMEIKGWYDEQELAMLDANARLRPSGVIGTMVPDPRLDEYTPEDFAPGVWLPAATLVIRGRLEKYKHDMNLDASTVVPANTPPWTSVNRGFLCRGRLKDCIPDRAVWAALPYKCVAAETVRYFGKIVSVKQEVMYKCVEFYQHEIQGKIPGVVRWAWFDGDEGGWWRCPTGCCFPE